MSQQYRLTCDRKFGKCHLLDPAKRKRLISPEGLSRLLETHEKPLWLIVPDQLLVGFWGRSKEQEPDQFRRMRGALFTTVLTQIVPLATTIQTFLPYLSNDVFSGLLYDSVPLSSGEVIRLFEPQSTLDNLDTGISWEVARSEFDPQKRLDPWYYSLRFVELRKKRLTWNAPLLREAFDIAQEMPNRLELPEKPKSGALHWLSSAQIHSRLHCIETGRITEGWGREGKSSGAAREPDIPLQDSDFLVSMQGIADVKIAEYYQALGPATRSEYLRRLHLKENIAITKSYHDVAVLWRALKSDDFLDQIRMELSDRVITPLKYVFPGDIKLVEPLKEPNVISRLTRLLAHTAASSAWEGLLDVKLREVVDLLLHKDSEWPSRFACCRAIWKVLENELDDTVCILAAEDDVAKKLADLLQTAGIPAVGHKIVCDTRELDPDLAQQIARCRCGIMATDAKRPMSVVLEHVAFMQTLDILGPDHIFALVLPPSEEPVKELPGRQLLKHVFSEAIHSPRVADVTNDDITAILELLRSKPPTDLIEVRLRTALLRLSKLGASDDVPIPTEKTMKLAEAFDFVRPFLKVDPIVKTTVC